MMPKSQPVEVLKKVVIDGFLFCGLALSLIATERLWKPFQRGFFCGDESLMFPYNDDTVTVLMLRIMSLLVPAVVFLICEWSYLRKETKIHQCFGVTVPSWLVGLYCALVSYYMGYCFVEVSANFAKNTIGRLRPHFFDICRPSVDCNMAAWRGRYIQPSEYHCTGDQVDKLNDMRKSFLSGHSAVAAYAMLYIVLYLQSRMSSSCTRVLRHCLQFVFLMMSWFTALSRVSDFKHHWSDVLAGYTAGSVIALVVWFRCSDFITGDNKTHQPLQPLEVHPTCHQSTLLTPLHEVVTNQEGAPPASA